MKVLVTSASRKIPLLHAVARQAADELPDAVVVAGDADPRCLAAYAWPRFVTLPADGESLAPALAAEGVTHVVPTRDGELAWFARHRAELTGHGIACLVAEPDAVAVCQDKLAFAERLAGAGLPAIPTSSQPLDAPRVVVKERHGAGSRGLLVDVDAETAARAAEALDAPVFQPYLHGPETSIDAYRAIDGRMLGLVARTRDLVVGGESQVTTTTDPAPYADLVRDVLEATGLTGHAVLQVIDTADGPRVVECNARLGGASTLSLAVGLLSVRWFLRESGGLDPADLPFTPRPWPVRLVRVPEDVVGDPRP